MYYINAKLNRFNCTWFFRYLSKNFKSENLYLYLDINSKLILIESIFKISRRTNISFVKMNLSDKCITHNTLKMIAKFCQKGPLAIFELVANNGKKLELINDTAIPFIYKSDTPLKYEKIYYFQDEIELDLLMIKYKMPALNCSYTSCIGKTIFIKNKKMSICKNKEYKRITINERNIINIVAKSDFSQEKLVCLIKKREECKGNCKLFNVCKSGCPNIIDDCIKESINRKINIQTKTNLFSEMNLRYKILHYKNSLEVLNEE